MVVTKSRRLRDQSPSLNSSSSPSPNSTANNTPSPEQSPKLLGTRMKTSMSMPSLSTAGAGVAPQFSMGGDVGGGVDVKDPKRQRRLERNRESARLSRRRRKQYLEVLEEKVNVLSEQMDSGRRQHVLNAIEDIKKVRRGLIDDAVTLDSADVQGVGKATQMIDSYTSASCRELRLALQFYVQQMKSLVLPPQTRFILWLTLQNDCYFAGGRDSSQRLSAARIGEKLLLKGKNRASPADGMWPLLCNDTGLSYDQEEKARAYQREVLQDQQSWMDRHAVGAITNTIETIYEVLKGLGALVEEGVKEESVVLTMQQRVKLLKYCSDNKERLQKFFNTKGDSEAEFGKMLQTINQYSNDSMKLGALTNVLDNVRSTLAQVPDVVVGDKIKKLSRRPSFESLASATVKEVGGGKGSSNNLVDMVNLDEQPKQQGGRRDQGQSITPEAAQHAFVGSLIGEAGRHVGTGYHPFQPGFVQVAGVGPVKSTKQQAAGEQAQPMENRITPEAGMWEGGLPGGAGMFGGATGMTGGAGMTGMMGGASTGMGGIVGMNNGLQGRAAHNGMDVMQPNHHMQPPHMQPHHVLEPEPNDVTTGRQKVDSMEVLDMVLNDIDMIASMPPPPQQAPTNHVPLQQHSQPPQLNMVGGMMGGVGNPLAVEPTPIIPQHPGAAGTDVDALMQSFADDGFLFDIASDDDWTIGGFADKSP
ncbi:hypothetical protein TrCOL_g7710 [Triparma columacea]|uniref:BZIP domain-containing protein n=1 Tax=Triparma columacea TaxID=722753 RepID=A0A9W7GQN7_9STRA|nr:hypothetical protein TrCOL_g7710 [Triparma columacea]